MPPVRKQEGEMRVKRMSLLESSTKRFWYPGQQSARWRVVKLNEIALELYVCVDMPQRLERGQLAEGYVDWKVAWSDGWLGKVSK